MTSLFVFALAATCASAPSGEEIAQKLAARAASDAASSFTATYRKEWKEEDITDPDNPKLNEERVWHIEGNGFRYTQTLTHEDGRAIEHARPEPRSSDARRAFVARYRFTVEPPCTTLIGEHTFWVVGFSPRTDVALPEGEDEDPLLNRLSGTMFIDAERWFVHRAVGQLVHPFSVKIVGRVTAAKLYLEQDDEDGVVSLRNVSAELWAESRIWPFKKKQYHVRRIYQFFRVPTETTPQLSPLP